MGLKSMFKNWGMFLLVAIFGAVCLTGVGQSYLHGQDTKSPMTTIVKLSDSQDATLTGDRLTVLFDEVSGTDNGFALEQACILHNVKYLDIVMINPGGNVFLMIDYLETMDRLQSRGVYITAYARGLIASAAVPIFVSADHRVLAPNCTVMVHPGSWRDERMGGWPEQYDQLFMRFEQLYARVISDHTNLSYAGILSIMQRNDTNSGAIYWSAEVALALGFADEIESFNYHKPAPPVDSRVDFSNERHYAKPDHTSDK